MVGGLLTLGTTWRTQYYLGAGIVFLIAILAFLTMPETAYARVVEVPGSFPPEHEGDLKKQLAASHLDRVCLENGHNTTDIPTQEVLSTELVVLHANQDEGTVPKDRHSPDPSSGASIRTLVYYLGWALCRNLCRSYSLAS
jgi:hypothetical protein